MNLPFACSVPLLEHTNSNHLQSAPLNVSSIYSGGILMNKSAIKSSHYQQPQQMSLLSAYMAKTATEITPNGLSIFSASRLPIHQGLDNDKTGIGQDRGSHPASETITFEPPESMVAYSRTVGAAAILLDESASSDDLASSPLSSRPYQTLTQEYNMDTWRMYQRIQTARASQSEKEFLSMVHQAVKQIHSGSIGVEEPEGAAGFSTAEQREAEEMFELDL